MWLPRSVFEAVEDVVVIKYVNQEETKRWNENRREGELRMLTGWCWYAKKGDRSQQGLKTRTCCVRDAYYAMVLHTSMPVLTRPRLRLVSRKAA